MGNSESRPNSREIAEHRAAYNRILAINTELEAEKRSTAVRLTSRTREIDSKTRIINELTRQNSRTSAQCEGLVIEKTCLESQNSLLLTQNDELALNISTYYQQATDLKSKLQKLCKFGANCKIKNAKHIKNHHPEKIDFTSDNWCLPKPEPKKSAPKAAPKPVNSISTSALKTVIEEEFDSNFSCFICYEVASGDNYQLTCCSQYICAGCYAENHRHNGSHVCPHCRSPRVQFQKISKLKSVLNDVRDNLVRNVISKMEENGGGTQVQAGDKNARTIFARLFPQGTKVTDLEVLPEFRKAIKVALPWNREDQQIRGFAFIEFSNEQDCLDALLASKRRRG